MTSAVEINGEQLVNALPDLSIQDQIEVKKKGAVVEEGCENHSGICAICLDKIILQETALVKGCEHAYCVTCILRWATYSQMPTCPQCKHPFEFLDVHRSLDGRIHDYMFEESVCLLLRATWFKPLIVLEEREEVYDNLESYYDYYPFEDEDDEEDEVYYTNSPSLRIGNRRWGDSGYVRSGRQEARPVQRSNFQDSTGAGSSCEPKNKETAKSTLGRRAKRTLKREAANKAAAEKHQEHLMSSRQK
ncbi:hypothetical protein Goshw_002916 [Gossypium schwendimanii]|uniref:RING-type domain-containing protein n=4 Tax=Gossypium TaxID=3633 RepID=A0A7J9MRW9_GOSSC|nr:hypothetical protein [Gossypium lobatum]MBA0700143.1 hypothetical protein [Gossypium aridum]MBA0873496.1 hypothetical protein [Gossypium schwendimanii]